MAASNPIPYEEMLGRGCVTCGAAALQVVFVVSGGGVPPGDPDHNIGYEHRLVARCPECGGLQLEVYDHDCFDFDSVYDQYEWFVLEGDLEAILVFLDGCEDPRDRACECDRHVITRYATRGLQRRSWRTAFEHDAHVHRARVWIQPDGPVFELVEP